MTFHRQLFLAAILSLTGDCVAAQEDIRLLPPIDSVVPPAEEVTPPDVPSRSTAEILDDGTAVLDGVVYPSWTQPFHWFLGPPWSGSVEMGMNGSEGNSDSLSFRVGSGLKRDTQLNTLELLINYGRNRQGGRETQNNGLMSGRWDWKLPRPNWIYYNRFQLEFDKFKAFDLRVTMASGLGYHLIKNEKTNFTPRVGIAMSHEFGGPDDNWVPEADFGFDFTHQISKKQAIKGTVDYYPSWENFSDYRLVSQVNWELLLDEATNLSLKLGAIDRYDSTPNGRRPNDIDYFLTLIWKM